MISSAEFVYNLGYEDARREADEEIYEAKLDALQKGGEVVWEVIGQVIDSDMEDSEKLAQIAKLCNIFRKEKEE